MSKTFKPVIETDRQFKVVQSIDARADFQLAIMDDFNGNKYVSFDKSDAPALALAILEVAGYVDCSKGGVISRISNAMYLIQEHVNMGAKATAEAKEQAELEGEALELFNANQGTDLDDWKYADRSVVSSWVRVARKAREMRPEK